MRRETLFKLCLLYRPVQDLARRLPMKRLSVFRCENQIPLAVRTSKLPDLQLMDKLWRQ
jgi:hypothetical protein